MSELLIILALVLANGVFAGAEIAVLSVRKTRLRELAEAGSRRARALLWLRAHPERFLATVQVAITVIGATAAAFGGSSVAARVAPLIAKVPGLEHVAHDIAMVLVVALVSYMSLVLGELVPKSLALRASEGYAMTLSQPLRLFTSLTRPLAWLLTESSNLVLKPFGDRTNFAEARVSVEELRQLVDEATRAGTLDSRSGEIAARALEFGDLAASAVMVPRNRMTALSLEAGLDDMRKVVAESASARLPVYHGSLDTIVGYVTIRDLAHGLLQGRLTSVADVLRPTHFVPRSSKAIHVLKELQRRQMQLAVVVDEHGGVSGILTLEDLIEELVGEVLAEDEQPEQRIHVESERVVLVAGSTPIRDVNRQLDLDLPEDGEGTTIAGLCIELAGDLPAKGARITDEAGITFEIVSATSRSVSQVRMELPPRSAKVELDD